MERQTDELVVVVPVLHNLEEIVEAVRLVPQVRAQQRIDVQIVDVLLPPSGRDC